MLVTRVRARRRLVLETQLQLIPLCLECFKTLIKIQN